MKFSHRKSDIRLRKFIITNLYWAISFISIICFLVAGGTAYSFFKAQVAINEARITSNHQQIVELKIELSSDKQKHSQILEWIAVVENHQQKILAEAKIANNLAEIDRITELIKKLDKIQEK